ncbi:MAG: hypothetical protein K2N22_00705 [Clostridia bacterium]|nr:hypothetical protein [Clostridia bacterium]
MKKILLKVLPKLKISICLALCLAVCIAAPCLAFAKTDKRAAADANKVVLKIWQIDSFEGGKGSRADFLQSIGDDFAKSGGSYVSVVSLSADAARFNLGAGNLPDLISYGAGMYGIESYIKDYVSWCHGGYCILSLDTATDFSDVNSKNTVINEGKDNFVGAAALLNGIADAEYVKCTTAYVSLINGKYKYLLGTQRDIFRLKTRGVSFAVKPLTEFNDLYQNISVTANGDRAALAKRFCNYLLSRTSEVNRVGMFNNIGGLYDDELRAMEGVSYDYKLISPVSENVREKLEQAVSVGDINMLKNLLK